MLVEVQRLSTLGATDFYAFVISGALFLAVSNEQDDELGGDVGSPIWALRPPEPKPKPADELYTLETDAQGRTKWA